MDTIIDGPVRPGCIVVGVDDSEGGEEALTWAADRAWRDRRQLVLAHATNPLTSNEATWVANAGITLADVSAPMKQEADKRVRAAMGRANLAHPELEVTGLVTEADPRNALLKLSEQALLLVVGSRGRGPVKSLLLGSVGMTLVRQASCPVAVVRPRPDGVTQQGVLVAIDATERSARTLEAAYGEAAATDATLAVLHCLWSIEVHPGAWAVMTPESMGYDDAALRVAEAVAGMSEKFPDVVTDVVLARGSVEECIRDLGTQHALVVVGRHGTSILDSLGVGSISVPVAESAHTVVLVVPDRSPSPLVRGRVRQSRLSESN